MYPFGNRKGDGLRKGNGLRKGGDLRAAAWPAGVALALGAASAARAQTRTFTFSGDLSGSQVVTLSQGGGSATSQVYAGRYKGQLGSAPASNIFCVDPGHEIAVGDTYAANTQYDITGTAGALNGGDYGGGLASALTDGDIASVTLTQASGRASEVAHLADTYLNASSLSGASGSTDTGANLTRLGLSVWDILQDGGDGLMSGQLRTGGSDAAAYGGLVSYYEGVAAVHTGYTSQTAAWVQAPQQAGTGRAHAGLRLREAGRRAAGRAGAGHPGVLVQSGPCRGRLLAAPAAAGEPRVGGSPEGGTKKAASLSLAAFFVPCTVTCFLLAQGSSRNLSDCQVYGHKRRGISLHCRARD